MIKEELTITEEHYVGYTVLIDQYGRFVGVKPNFTNKLEELKLLYPSKQGCVRGKKK